jgi:DNA-binding beta-propeller fold protein YncE
MVAVGSAGLAGLAAWALMLGLCVSQGCRSTAPIQYDTPTELTQVAMPSMPATLAWSADGASLAAGPFYGNPDQVLIVDVTQAAVTTALKVPAGLQGLAFSPDGKWLAVGTCEPVGAAAAAELVVFDVPAFTRKFTAKAAATKGGLFGFLDLAWAGDSKSLYAIEGVQFGGEKNQVRRWGVPDFTEQPAIQAPQAGKYSAIGVSPDGKTLAVADEPSGVDTRRVRLFDVPGGTERSSFRVGSWPARLGFSPDGRAVGVFDTSALSWWEPATGRPATPEAHVAIQPAGLADERAHRAVSPDGGKQASGTAEYPTLFGQGLGEPENKYGAFVRGADNATGKRWVWRVGEAAGTSDAPVVAFSPDGTKLAGTARRTGGEALLIWAVSK